MDATAARAAMETCDIVGVLRSLDCDEFSEVDVHGPVCSARIGRTVFLVPPSEHDTTTDGVHATMRGMIVAKMADEDSARAHYQHHLRAMHAAAMVHDMVCRHDGPEANPLMDLLGSTPPDAPPPWL